MLMILMSDVYDGYHIPYRAKLTRDQKTREAEDVCARYSAVSELEGAGRSLY